MSDVSNGNRKKSVESVVSLPKNFDQAANHLCEKALNDAKAQLHPLLRNVELDRLDRRYEFVQAFKFALERRIAKKIAVWQPGIQAVFKFDESWRGNGKSWDSSIHLLVKVHRLSDAMKAFAKKLDKSLLRYLKHLRWSRFQKRKSILEIQQVTLDEIRHGTSYGAMFSSVYSAPVKVWPRDGRRDESHRRQTD